MARNHANNGRIYRAVITLTFADGRTRVHTYGPYDVPAPGKGQITQWKHQAEQSRGQYRKPENAFSAVGHIESAEVVWMRESAEVQP